MSKAQVSQQRREAHRQSVEKSQRRKGERKERRIATGGRIFPDIYYPLAEARAFLGLGATQTWEHINAGHLPKPVAPCEGSSARGYYGRTLLKIQAQAEERV